MRKFIGASLFIAALGLPLALPATADAQADVTIEKKTTTTSPSGRFVVENETTRTFKVEGDTHTYVAPPDVDIGTLTGKEVTVTVDSNGKVTKVVRKTTTVP